MKDEYQAAISELKDAYNILDNAAPEYADAALLKVIAARKRVDGLYKELKGGATIEKDSSL